MKQLIRYSTRNFVLSLFLTLLMSYAFYPCVLHAANECSDGIDNDGDGLVDWQYDLGCFGHEDQDEGGRPTMSLQNGWTLFEPASDTQVTFVSSIDGNDTTCRPYTINDLKSFAGNYSSVIPCKSISKAKTKVRSQYPDWLLFKRGDIWTNENFGVFNVSGRSFQEPMIIGTYGNSFVRPLIQTGVAGAYDRTSGGHDLVFLGLHLTAHLADGNTDNLTGFNDGVTQNNVLLEDMKIERYQFGLLVQQGLKTNYSIRRSVISDNFHNTDHHSSGIFASYVTNFLSEECVWDHNGWSEEYFNTGPTTLNHNFYLSSNMENTILRRNIISRASANGINLNDGSALVEDNLVVKNPIGIHMRTMSHVARNNVVLEGADIGSGVRGWGIDVGPVWNQPVRDPGPALVEGNIVANKTSSGKNFAISILNDTTLAHGPVTLRQNIVYDWEATGLDIGPKKPAYGSIAIENNIWQEPNPNSEYLITLGQPNVDSSVFTFRNNNYSSARNVSSWFGISGAAKSYSDWLSVSGETGSSNSASHFSDPTRSMGSYNSSLGGAGTSNAFLEEAKKQSKYSWRPAYTACAANNFIREGFGVAALDCGAASASQFLIVAAASSNGSISPSGNIIVSQGNSQTFTFSPAAGFDVQDILIDGVSVGNPTSYTFSNVQSNHTIEARFGSNTGNQRPSVNAGEDQTITLPNLSLFLEGNATDDDGPEPLTTTWTLASGPASVAFADFARLNTSVTFSEKGIYVFRLTASDGAFSSSDDMQVTVNDASDFNQSSRSGNRPIVCNNPRKPEYKTTPCIGYSNQMPQSLEISIFTLGGHKVRDLLREEVQPGDHQTIWDGRNNAGDLVASNIYIAEIKMGENLFRQKLAIVR